MNTQKIVIDFLETLSADDSGNLGKAFEIGTRSYISQRTVTKVKKQGTTDITASSYGKRYTCEIKTACGEVETAAKSQLIIYCPNVNPLERPETQGYVFTREQWLEFLDGYTGRGSFLREDKKRGHLHIQSFYWSEEVRPKASKAITRYILETLETLPTVEEFFNR